MKKHKLKACFFIRVTSFKFEFMMEIIPQRVTISDKTQLAFWCNYFGCSSLDLLEAVNKIGTCTEEVKLYLSKKPSKKGLMFWWEYMK
jgi:hypothetical protein